MYYVGVEIFIAIERWDKNYKFRKIEKVGKSHVPTCPVFAGPVTNRQLTGNHKKMSNERIYYIHENLYGGTCVVHGIFFTLCTKIVHSTYSVRAYLGYMYKNCHAYVHACMHTYIHAYIQTHRTYINYTLAVLE